MPVLQVSDITRRILKNFSSISNEVLLLEGKHQKTAQLPSRAVLALAEFPEAWPKTTGLHDLKQFLSILSLFENPTLDFEDAAMVVSDADKRGLSIRYRYSNPSVIPTIADRTIPKDNPAVEFTLSSDDLSQLKKHTSLLQLKDVTIGVKDGGIVITAGDARNSESHGYELDIPKSEVTLHDKSFARAIPFKVEHLPMLLDGNYTVALSDWRHAYLTNLDAPVTYYIAQQTKSND